MTTFIIYPRQKIKIETYEFDKQKKKCNDLYWVQVSTWKYYTSITYIQVERRENIQLK